MAKRQRSVKRIEEGNNGKMKREEAYKVIISLERNDQPSISQAVMVTLQNGKFQMEQIIEPNTSMIRLSFDVPDACIMMDMQVCSEPDTVLSFLPMNGRAVKPFFLFDQPNPKCLIRVKNVEKASLIRISGYLIEVTCSALMQTISNQLASADQIAFLRQYDEQQLCKLAKLEKRFKKLDQQYKHVASELYQVSIDKSELQQAYDATVNSFFWKLTKPLRLVCNGIKRVLRAFPLTNMIFRVLLCVKEKGVRYTIHKTIRRMTGQDVKEDPKEALRFSISRGTRKQQEKTKFENPCLFDILVYLGETSEGHVRQLIQSVTEQTYPYWKLYLVESQGSHEGLKTETEKNDQILWLSGEGLSQAQGINLAFRESAGQYKMIVEAKDLLHPSALFECRKAIDNSHQDLYYTDEAAFCQNPNHAFDYHFKPDFSPVTLRGHNYIQHLVVVSSQLWKKTGDLNDMLDEPGHYDWILRLSEKTDQIQHITKALYYTREEAEKAELPDSDACQRMQSALQQHLDRIRIKGKVLALKKPGTFRVQYALTDSPLVSILIPNKDHVSDLSNCLNSVMDRSTYRNFEIIIIENNSTESDTFEFYEEIQKEYEQIRVVYWDGIFNYSGINNYGAQFAKGEYILLLNNDVEVITPDWLEEMLGFAQQEKTGAVGVMLYYPDDTIQHAGVTIGVQGVGGHAFREFSKEAEGYHNRLLVAQNESAVTAACMMLPKKVYDQMEGLDERFEVAFNDVDLCMRILHAHYDIIFTPFAKLYHFESKSRGTDEAPEKRKRFVREVMLFTEEWKDFLDHGDPYYNPNLTLDSNDFSYRK